METELDLSHPEYIKVMISGLIVKPELISLMGEILQHPQYQEKHTLWDFRQASLGLSIGDLKELVGIMKLYTATFWYLSNRILFISKLSQ
ncbi:MAG: hypothetical protein R6U68_00355 [Desulfobacteraceae bacterium]